MITCSFKKLYRGPVCPLSSFPQWEHLEKLQDSFTKRDINIDTVKIQNISITTWIPQAAF